MFQRGPLGGPAFVSRCVHTRMHVGCVLPACVCAHANACGLCVRAACVCFRASREQLRPSLHERTAPRTPVEAGPAPAARDPPVEAGRSTLHLRLGALR